MPHPSSGIAFCKTAILILCTSNKLKINQLKQKIKTYQILAERVRQNAVPLYPVIKDIKTTCQ